MLPEENTAPSVSLTQSLAQTMKMPTCSFSCSDMTYAKKDCRVATVEQQQLEHSEFYYCIVEKGWFCKTCVSFSGISSRGVPYITKAGIFGDYCLQRSTGHLESEHHKEVVKNMQSYDTPVHKCTNISNAQ